jgi:hypothetical protein
MPAKVVDASVLAAIAFQEPRFAEAVALRKIRSSTLLPSWPMN